MSLKKLRNYDKKMDGTQKNIVRRKIIFCESYNQIQWVLYFALECIKSISILIVLAGNSDLPRFFELINKKVFNNKLNFIELKPYKSKRAQVRGVKKILYVPLDIVKEKLYLRNMFRNSFSDAEDCEVFFSGGGFHCHSFYLLKLLGKKNKLVYVDRKPPKVFAARGCNPKNYLDFCRLVLARMIYGGYISLGKLPYLEGFLFRSPKFLKEKVDRIIGWKEMEDKLKDFKLSQFQIFNHGDIRVIYFDQSFLYDLNYIADKKVVEEELNQIFELLVRYFPERQIARKYHPDCKSDINIIKIGKVLPDYIPAEFLYSDNVKLYLSLCSGAIVNIEKGLVVSIIDMLSPLNKKKKEDLKSRLIKRSKSKVLFPKSLNEFEKILNRLFSDNRKITLNEERNK